MYFDLEYKLNEYVKKNDLKSAIELAELELCKIPQTNFHQLLGMNLLHMESELSKFISTFYSNVKYKYALNFTKKL